MIAAANSGYSLITATNKLEYLSLTPLGMRVVSARDEGAKYEAIYEVLFSNPIFAAFVSRYNDKPMPLDEIGVDYLVKNHNLSEEDAKLCLSVFKDNLSDFGLTEESLGKRVIISRETVLKRFGKQPKQIPVSPPALDEEESPESPIPLPLSNTSVEQVKIPFGSKQPNLQFTFNIQIVIPENASPDTYNRIFEAIADNLLRHGEK